MASVSAFNDLMEQFLGELSKTFPEEKGVKKFQNSFDLMKKANPKKCVEIYMNGISPYNQKITNKDETFFTEDASNIEGISDLNIQKYWNDDLSENTKNAIWQYLQTLYMLGTTIVSIPQETLDMIESVAKQCADKIQSGDGEMDEAALMNTMSSLFGGLMKNKN